MIGVNKECFDLNKTLNINSAAKNNECKKN